MLKWKIKGEGTKKKEMMLIVWRIFILKETLNLIDNLERSKITLENDESLKGSDGFEKNYKSFRHNFIKI